MAPSAPQVPARFPFANPTVMGAVGSNTTVSSTANHYVLITTTAAGITITISSGKSHTIVNRGNFPFVIATTGNQPTSVAPGIEFAVAWNAATVAHIIWPRTIGGTVLPTADVRAYGAKGNSNSTGSVGDDDLAAIQAAIDAGGAFLPGANKFYKITGTLTNPNAYPVICEGTIVYTGTGTAITVGQSGAQTYGNSVQRSVYRVIKSARNYAHDGSGVLVQNLAEFDIAISAAYFKRGAKFLGNFGAMAYGTVAVGAIWDCQYAVELESSGTGYCNEILWLGGRYTNYTGINEDLVIAGVHLVCENTNSINGHTWVKPTFELINAFGGRDTFAFYGESATQAAVWNRNVITGYRLELTDYLVGGEGAEHNTFESTFDQYDPMFDNKFVKGLTSADEVRMIATNEFKTRSPFGQPDWTDLVTFDRRSMCKLNSGNIMAPARGCFKFSGDFFGNDSAGTGVVLQKDHIEFSAGSTKFLGTMIDFGDNTAVATAEVFRKIRIALAMRSANGRIVCKVWDKDFNLLTSDNECSHAQWDDTWKIRTDGSELDQRLVVRTIAVSPTVRYMFLGFGGAALAKLARMSISVPYQSQACLMMDGGTLDSLKNQGGSAIGAQGVVFLEQDNPRASGIPAVPAGGDTIARGTVVTNFSSNQTPGNTGQLMGWYYNGTAWEVLPGSQDTDYAAVGTITSGTSIDITKLRNVLLSYAGAATITTITGDDLQTTQIRATNANPTIQNNANIKLAGAANWTAGASGGSIVLRKESGVWYQIGAAVNY